MKKVLQLVLASTLILSLVLLLVGCTGEPAPATTTQPPQTTTQPPTQTTAQPSPTATQPSPSPTEEVIKVRMLRPMASYDDPFSASYRMTLEKGNELGKGRVVFVDIGGPEVFPTFEQIKALKAGSVDLLDAPATYATTTFFESSLTESYLFGQTVQEMRDAGLVTLIDKIGRQKHGVGVITPLSIWMFNIFTNKPVNKLADLEGQKLRATPLYQPILQHWGASPVTLTVGETITALQTGVVDGVCWPNTQMTTSGLAAYVKYQVFPLLWTSWGNWSYYNAKWFDSLPKYAQDIVVQAVMYAQQNVDAFNYKQMETENKQMRAAGITATVIPEEEWWQAQEVSFNEVNKKVRAQAPDSAEDLIKIFSQFYPPKKVMYPPFDWK